MSKIQSDIVEIPQSSEKVFNFLTDFNNFSKLMPPQVSNWKSDKESCSFTINGMATVGMRIKSQEPHNAIHIVSDGDKLPFQFTLDVLLKNTTDTSCTGQLIFEADIPIFLRPMIEGPLKNFFNLLAHKMKDIS
ncbi:MAG: hypothetical protein Fur0041_08190 [Bacteroidia bacterium]